MHLLYNLFLYSSLMLLSLSLTAQNVSISDSPNTTPDPNAMLDVSSTTKGVLFPRLTTAQRTALGNTNPQNGTLVYDSDQNSYWYWVNGGWVELAGSGSSTPSGPAGGNLSGTYPNPTVAQIQGQLVSPAIPQQGQVMMFDNGEWKPISLPIYIPDIAIFEERYVQGTCPNYADGNKNTYQIRRLNTIHANSPSNSVTLISPNTSIARIQFQPGKYLINASATIVTGGAHKLFLIDPNDNNEIKLTGMNGLSDNSGVQTTSSILGTITVGSGGISLALAHKFNSNAGICIFGTTSNFTDAAEVYARIMIQKIQ